MIPCQPNPCRPNRCRSTRRRLIAFGLSVAVAATASSCSDDDPSTITLVAYDSFPTSADSAITQALAEFTDETGIEVEVLVADDTGTMLSKAALTAGNPEGDVMWGIDNTFLSRAVAAEIFEPYVATGVDALPPEMTALAPDGVATPVDFGDVCVNVDLEELDRRGVPAPISLAALADPMYQDMLVVEDPGTSSPGLAFLLATIAEFGEDGWEAYWASLRANGVLVVDSWSTAYYDEFSATAGDRPLVVSYGSSPPFEVIFAEEPIAEPTTTAVDSTCFRQVEFAGVLRGTDAPGAARQLVDFLISPRFQQEVALELFVFPVNPDVALAPEFTDFAVVPDAPHTVDPALIDQHRSEWIDRWSAVMTG